MAFVITEKCLGERYGRCVPVCPVEAIHPGEYKGKPFMAIDPDACIECGACAEECPVGSIVPEAENAEWAKINRECTETFKGNPSIEARPANDPPRKPGNKLK